MAADTPSHPEGKHTERSRKLEELKHEVDTFGEVRAPDGCEPKLQHKVERYEYLQGFFEPCDVDPDSGSVSARVPRATTGRLVNLPIKPEDVVSGSVHIDRGESADAEEPLAESSPEHGPGSADGPFMLEHSGRISRLIQMEAQASAASSVQAFGERFVEVVAAAHGLGPAYQCAKWAYGVVKWLHVIDGDGGVGLQIPFPMGAGVLSPQVHLGGSSDVPWLTLSVAPTDVSGVGGLVLGRLEIDPEVTRADRQEARTKRYGPVEAIPWHSPDGLRKPILLPRGMTAAPPLIEYDPPSDDVVLMVRRKKRRLHAAGVDLVIWYDLATGLVVWEELGGADGPRSWSIADDLRDPQ